MADNGCRLDRQMVQEPFEEVDQPLRGVVEVAALPRAAEPDQVGRHSTRALEERQQVIRARERIVEVDNLASVPRGLRASVEDGYVIDRRGVLGDAHPGGEDNVTRYEPARLANEQLAPSAAPADPGDPRPATRGLRRAAGQASRPPNRRTDTHRPLAVDQ